MKKVNFCDGWTFTNGTIKKEVTLPHDAMLENGRRKDAPGGSAVGFFDGGSYTYEKKIELPNEWEDKKVILEFEGVYKNAVVLVNGEEKGSCAYGYRTFFVDCGVLKEGTNTVTVQCENQNQPDSRWYSGAGIYRPVWAWVGDGITSRNISVVTKSIRPAVIEVKVDDLPIFNNGKEREAVSNINTSKEYIAQIYEGDALIATGMGEIEIPEAKLWNEKNPHLYRLVIDDVEVKFGIREITWNENGLFVNGESTLLKGGCLHSDNGILGAAVYEESEWRRVRILKDAGYNAIRASHNPCSEALLNACDALGVYVMDETWDMWYNHKSPYDYAGEWEENYIEDVRSMVLRDRNHPSVLMYSIGNEVSEPAREKGIHATEDLVKLFHELDATRPVTGGFNLMIISSASKGKGIYDDENGGRKESSSPDMGKMNSTMFNLITSMVGTGMNKAANSKKADEATSPSLDLLDIAGYNYASGRYEKEGIKHPGRLVVGSETFPQDLAKNWEMVEKYPYLIGDFMWTAWDYLGEAGIGAWGYTDDAKGFEKPYPWLLADVGAFDICGNPNGEAFWASAVWHQLESPSIAVRPINHPGTKPIKGSWRGTNALPSWSWKGCDGNQAVVEVYFDCAFIELFINGKKVGKKKVKNCRAIFKTKYEPGSITAIAYDKNGSKVAQSTMESATSAQIQICPEKTVVDSGEILYVPISIGDNRNVECNADTLIHVNITNGELLGFGSANPRTEENYQAGEFTTYYGQALAVIRAGKQGKLIIEANGIKTEVDVK